MTTFVNNDVGSGDTIFASDHNEQGSRIAEVLNGNIDSNNLADSAVTTAKLANDAVTAAKVDFGGSGAGIWWEEIGRTTLGTAGDIISAPNLPARAYLKILVRMPNSGSIAPALRFNNDTGNNYAHRYSVNNGESGGTSTSVSTAAGITAASSYMIYEGTIFNIASSIKLGVIVGTTSNASNSASVGPSSYKFDIKWANTTDQITRIDVVNTSTGDFAAGAELVVLGHD